MISIDELCKDKRYQVVMPVHPKDHTKLSYIIERVFWFTEASAIHIMAYDPVGVHNSFSPDSRVHVHDEHSILPESRGIFPDIRQGQGWYFQQFLELFQDVTDTDWYIGLNCDLLFNSPYPVFKDGRPVQVLSRDKNSQREHYNPFNRAMFGPTFADAPWNYLSDASLYNKRITRQMAESLGYDVAGFMRRSAELINLKHTPGDANLYMHYVHNVYPSLYRLAELSNAMNGLYNGGIWSRDKIDAAILLNRDAATISFHTWGLIK